MFEHMKIGKFVVRARAVEDLILPAYKGSTLRGGFGHALKRVTCALRNQTCGQCLLRERCVYIYLFETPPPKGAEMMRLYPAAPHPFVIEPPDDGSRTIGRGELLEFGLVLVGNAVEYLSYFICAFTALGNRGLGKGRAKFHLEEVLGVNGTDRTTVYEHTNQLLQPVCLLSSANRIKNLSEILEKESKLTLHFVTPVRIKWAGHLVQKPEFHHLIRSLLRRISSLSYFHCNKKLELDFRGLIQQALGMERVCEDVDWCDLERYSTRQKQRMKLGGFIGSATYAGDLAKFLPLLALGEVLHVGKAAGFGLGRYRIDACPRETVSLC